MVNFLKFLSIVFLLGLGAHTLNAAAPAPTTTDDTISIFTVVLGNSDKARAIAREKNAVLLPEQADEVGIVCSLVLGLPEFLKTAYYDFSMASPDLQNKLIINFIHCDFGFAIGRVNGRLIMHGDDALIATTIRIMSEDLRRKLRSSSC